MGRGGIRNPSSSLSKQYYEEPYDLAGVKGACISGHIPPVESVSVQDYKKGERWQIDR